MRIFLGKFYARAKKIIIGLKKESIESATIASHIWERTVQIIRVVNWFQIGICSDVTTNLLIFVKREEINEEKIALGGESEKKNFSSCWQIEKLNWKLVYFTRPFKGEILCRGKSHIDLVFTQTHVKLDDDCEREWLQFWCLLAFLVSSSSINITQCPLLC